MLRRIRKYFFSGILVVVPIYVTIWIIWTLFNLLDGWYRKFAMRSGWRDYLATEYSFPEYGIGFVLTITVIILIGFFSRLYIGKTMLYWVEIIFNRLPIISNIYNAIKQVTATLMGRKTRIFEKVVLVEYPRKGMHSLAFVTSKDADLIQPIIGKELLYVFIPTTPNPTSGYFLIIPEEDAIPLDISVEDGMKMLISCGMVSPAPNSDILTQRKTVQIPHSS
jgi:uncharacterized membrane protein